MHVYDNPQKPAASMGTETRRRIPKDNIDLDMEEAERLGYGVHYGRYKADHPNTKEAREARLYPKKKQPQVQPRKMYDKVCPVCGMRFSTPVQARVYCTDACKWKNDGIRYREKKQKEEALKNV